MTTPLQQFRQQLYESLSRRPDALMDLLDTLCSTPTARSVVELSLHPPFRWGYSSLYTAITQFFQATSPQTASSERQAQEQKLMRLIVPYLPVPQKRKFWLLGLDGTPAPRPFADTLEDRTYVYHPNPIGSNKPITIGHQYSTLVVFPEKDPPTAPPWVVPLSMRRVNSQQTATGVGAQQVETLLEEPTLPFSHDLCVQVVDSAYSAVSFLSRVARHPHLVTIARLRGNRTLYRMPLPPPEDSPQRGHPTWYGPAFPLGDPTRWDPPDQVAQTSYTTRRGQTYTVHLEGWHNLLMRGSRQGAMHRHPFTLMRCRVVDTEGKPVFQHPLWLLVMGPRRQELSLRDAWQAYGQRYDLEPFFRFGKQRLLLTAYQTPQVEHEENWWQIVPLAYVQLWLARALAQALPRPWERSVPSGPVAIASPPTVQRDFGRIIRQIGTPAEAPQPRGKSPGRVSGQRPRGRTRQPVLKKGAAAPRKAPRAA